KRPNAWSSRRRRERTLRGGGKRGNPGSPAGDLVAAIVRRGLPGEPHRFPRRAHGVRVCENRLRRFSPFAFRGAQTHGVRGGAENEHSAEGGSGGTLVPPRATLS